MDKPDLSIKAGPFSDELSAFLAVGRRVSQAGSEKLDHSYTTLFTTFFFARDPVSQWFQTYCDETGIDRDPILKTKEFDEARFKQLMAEPAPPADAAQEEANNEAETSNVSDNPPPERFSDSLDSIFTAAREIADSVDDSPPLTVQHVLAAYFYRPRIHSGQIESWGFNREHWSDAFLVYLRDQKSPDLRAWIDVHRKSLSAPPHMYPSGNVFYPWNPSDYELSENAARIIDTAWEMARETQTMPLTTLGLFFAALETVLTSDAYGADRPAFDMFLRDHFNREHLRRLRDSKEHYYGPDGSWADDLKDEWSIRSKSMTDYVKGSLDLARRTAEQTTNSPQIDVRHLVAGLLFYKPQDPHASVRSLLYRVDIDVPAFQEAYTEHFSTAFPGDNRSGWRKLRASISEPSLLAGFLTDGVPRDGLRDLVGISDQVNALAMLIASHKTYPPLAIGIFGDWGSGKSFFMRQLRDEIQRLATRARNSTLAQRELAYYKHIIQVEFNAWHYVEGEMWASLVEHIFRNLSQEKTSLETLLKTLQTQVLQEMTDRQKDLELVKTERDEAQNALEKLEEERDTLEQERNQKQQELVDLTASNYFSVIKASPAFKEVQKLLNEMWVSQTDGRGGTGTSIASTMNSTQDVHNAITGLKNQLNRGSALLLPMLTQPGRFWLLLAALILGPLAALVTYAVATEVQALAELDTVIGAFSGISALLAGITTWLRSQTLWVKQRLDTVEQASHEIDRVVAEKVAETDADIAALMQEIDRLNAQVEEKIAEEQAIKADIETLEHKLRSLEPQNLLANFIAERYASDDYRKYLGIVARVREDFDTLSRYINLQNKKLLDDETPDEENVRINRIVLYIDDLDRCPPDKVAKVLQAVHLLLAFPLFVVVVGVDARWIAHCLQDQYPSLLVTQKPKDTDILHPATPYDYLEKVFQIPLWLSPLNQVTTSDMLQGLLQAPEVAVLSAVGTSGDGARSDRANGGGQAAGDGEEQKVGTPAASGDVAAGTPAATGDTGGGTGGDATGGTAGGDTPAPETAHDDGESDFDPDPESLTVSEEELEFMKQLAGLLGRSPRAVKRYINTYRLIKAELKPSQQQRLLLDRYRAIQFLLAIVIGLPALMQSLFRLILEADDPNSKRDPRLNTILDVANALPDNDDPDAKNRLREWLETHPNGQIPISELALFVHKVSSYSFRERTF